MTFVARLLLLSILFLEKKYHQLMGYLFSINMRERAISYGENVHFYYPFTVYGIENIKFGNNVHINKGAYINAAGGMLEFGDNVHIGPNVLIYTVNHNYLGGALPYDETLIAKPVVIDKNVWIGANVTIVPGTKISAGAIIGAGSVISGSIPPLAIVVSEKPRVIGYREQEHYDQLDAAGHYGGVSGKLYIGKKKGEAR